MEPVPPRVRWLMYSVTLFSYFMVGVWAALPVEHTADEHWRSARNTKHRLSQDRRLQRQHQSSGSFASRNGRASISLDIIQVYPDETPQRLTACLAEELQVPAETIMAGNGATDLLYFWLRVTRPRTATLIVPTFSEYRRALQGLDVAINVLRVIPDNQFTLPVIPVARPTTMILTNPNNPTGTYAQPPTRGHARMDPSCPQIHADPAR